MENKCDRQLDKALFLIENRFAFYIRGQLHVRVWYQLH